MICRSMWPASSRRSARSMSTSRTPWRLSPRRLGWRARCSQAARPRQRPPLEPTPDSWRQPPFVKAALDALIGGAPGALDTLNELAAALADDAEFAATIAAAIALKADSASVVRHDTVQALTIAQQYQARTNISAGFGFENRLINPLYLVDIQGNAGGVTSGQHVVEGWCMAGNTDVAVSTMSRQIGGRVPYCLRYTVTTGSDASIGAAQYLIIQTAIEGYDIADAKWGTVEAKSIWVCGRIKAPTTGVYCLCVRNGLGDRRYVF
jgi:hypothetical protein